jgi:hypothetical protein
MTALEEYEAIGQMNFWEALDLLKRMADELRAALDQLENQDRNEE